jgi:hypothetical protein
VPGFAMPIRVIVNSKPIKITPAEELKSITSAEAIKTFEVDHNYYIDSAALK